MIVCIFRELNSRVWFYIGWDLRRIEIRRAVARIPKQLSCPSKQWHVHRCETGHTSIYAAAPHLHKFLTRVLRKWRSIFIIHKYNYFGRTLVEFRRGSDKTFFNYLIATYDSMKHRYNILEPVEFFAGGQDTGFGDTDTAVGLKTYRTGSTCVSRDCIFL